MRIQQMEKHPRRACKPIVKTVGAQLCLSPDCGIVSSEHYVSLGYSPTHGTELMPIGMVMDSHILGTDAESWYLARNTRKKKTHTLV